MAGERLRFPLIAQWSCAMNGAPSGRFGEIGRAFSSLVVTRRPYPGLRPGLGWGAPLALGVSAGYDGEVVRLFLCELQDAVVAGDEGEVFDVGSCQKKAVAGVAVAIE